MWLESEHQHMQKLASSRKKLPLGKIFVVLHIFHQTFGLNDFVYFPRGVFEKTKNILTFFHFAGGYK